MSNRLIKKLAEPYPCSFTPATYLRVGLISGLFVFLFFFFLQPFGLSDLGDSVRLPLYAGYGLTCLVLIALNSIVGPRLFPRWFREEKWNVVKHIVFGTWIILTIGFACFLLTRHIFRSAGLTLRYIHLSLVVGGALAIGAIPFTVMTLIDQIILLGRSSRAANEANTRIETPHSLVKGASAADQEVALVAANGKDTIRFGAASLLYVSADENYVTVHFKKEQPTEAILRSSITRIEQQLGDFRPGFFRCHRTFIINVAKIRNVSGNAQGLKLKLEDVAQLIPVARRYVEEFRRTVVPRL